MLPALIRSAKKSKKINITINKDSLKNYLHIEEAIPIILDITLKGRERLYNLAGKKRFRFIDIAKKIQKKLNCKIILSNQNIVLNDPMIDISKVRKEFKFNPKRDLIKDLDNIIDNLS